MSNVLRIAVADDEPRMLQFYQKVITQCGHTVVALASNGRQLVELCHDYTPDLVITDIKMPDMDGLEAAAEVRDSRPIPFIIVSAHHDPTLVETALENHVLAYLVKPIKRVDLEPAIALAMRRFKEFKALELQADDLRQALEDRKLIERAKGSLMKRSGLEEHEAFRRLQKMATERSQKLVDIARIILTAEEAYGPAGKG